MRLLFVAKREPQQRDLVHRPYGRFHWLPVELARRGHAVSLLLVSHRGVAPASLERGGVRVSTFNLRGAGILRTLAAVEAEARAFGPDWVIGCSDCWYGWLAARLAKRTEACLAIDAYDDYESYMPWNLPLHWAWRRALRSADLVTAAGPHLASLLNRARTGKAPAVVLPMAADPEFTPMDRAACRRMLGLEIAGRYLGYVGSWSGSRGSNALLGAFRIARLRYPNLRLIVSGRPPPAVQAEPGVVTTGYLPDAQMPLLLNALDVACVVTADTAFGRSSYPAKLCEAMACEVPVVATETAPVAWMLDQNPSHLVPLGDPVAFANQIIAQLESPSAGYLTRPSWSGIALGLEQALLQSAD